MHAAIEIGSSHSDGSECVVGKTERCQDQTRILRLPTAFVAQDDGAWKDLSYSPVASGSLYAASEGLGGDCGGADGDLPINGVRRVAVGEGELFNRQFAFDDVNTYGVAIEGNGAVSGRR